MTICSRLRSHKLTNIVLAVRGQFLEIPSQQPIAEKMAESRAVSPLAPHTPIE